MFDRQKITKAVIPAAGFGTRMLPATKAVPKEMLPVAGKPLIQYAVEESCGERNRNCDSRGSGPQILDSCAFCS
jgi:CTP:molybdopterin cytidylyltransferase MocA